MTNRSPFPSRNDINICFAHVAYPMDQVFLNRNEDLRFFQVRNSEEMDTLIKDANILVVSGLWSDHLLDTAPKLRFIQSIGAGFDQFPLDKLRERGIRLASASGVNRNAVSEHALALILSLSRHIHTGRDNQNAHFWRGMISDINTREDELSGKTLGIIGLGSIGSRVAKLAKAFDMQVLATKRDTSTGTKLADEVYSPDSLPTLLERSDFVVLNCPLTEDTREIINEKTLSIMKPSSYLINVARGACVNENALIHALNNGEISGAGLDHFWDDPLPDNSPFWEMKNVIITPHTAGETRLYEENVIDILLENIDRLCSGEGTLVNQVV